MNIKVIAIGNILMGNDSIGIRAVKKIKSYLRAYGINTIIGETDFQYCISMINDGDFIFIIDAACVGIELGDITVISLDEYDYGIENCCTQHSCSLLNLINIYHKNIKGYILGIEVKDIVCSLNISSDLEKLLDSISFNVLNKILELS